MGCFYTCFLDAGFIARQVYLFKKSSVHVKSHSTSCEVHSYYLASWVESFCSFVVVFLFVCLFVCLFCFVFVFWKGTNLGV